MEQIRQEVTADTGLVDDINFVALGEPRFYNTINSGVEVVRL